MTQLPQSNNKSRRRSGPEQQGRRDANQAVVGATREWGAQQLDELGLIIDKLIYSIVEQYGEGPSYAGQACLDLLQNGQTTTYAIALLLEHGYLADAEARWRGIYELACSAALLAMAEDVDRTAMRYLVHGRRLPARDPAYKASWATPDFFDMNYEWLREDHPHLNHRGVPKPFRPSWVFSTANLTGAPFTDWIVPSHHAVHMTSAAVATGSRHAGAAPSGYSHARSMSIASRTACTLNDLVAQLCLVLGTEWGFDESRYLGWPLAFHAEVTERVTALVKGQLWFDGYDASIDALVEALWPDGQ
jgi:hypothetical protein